MNEEFRWMRGARDSESRLERDVGLDFGSSQKDPKKVSPLVATGIAQSELDFVYEDPDTL